MDTVGLIGIGKIGLPIADNLIKSGHRVVGYRRSSLAEFEKIGGVPARSAADVGAQADIVLTCLPSTAALDDVVGGPRGLVHSARQGQIVAELGSHPVPDKRRQIAETAYLAAGATAIFEGNPFERRFRDMHAVSQQAQAQFAIFEVIGRHFLGLPLQSTRII